MLAAGLAGGCVIHCCAIAGGYLVGESAAVTESQAASLSPTNKQTELRAQDGGHETGVRIERRAPGWAKGLARRPGCRRGGRDRSSRGRGAGQTFDR